jgi:hypothetical protein
VRSTGCLFLVLGLLSASVVYAEPPINVQVEVEFLLGYVEGSGCEFYRNGTWHDPKAARAHLRDKYRYLAAGNLINTTEDFIEKVATQSSLSGQPYKVRCRDGATVTAKQWLRAELARFREFNKRPTSSLLQKRHLMAAGLMPSLQTGQVLVSTFITDVISGEKIPRRTVRAGR